MRNEGATCDNCQFKGGHNRKQCTKCLNGDFRPGWEPAAGIKVTIGTAIQGATGRQYNYRKVVQA